MLQTVIAPPPGGGGPGSDTTAARLTDPRFYGIQRVDMRAKYKMIQDGQPHPLSSMGLAAAQALYPNIGLTSSTDLTKWYQDSAALAQAEYDLRTGPGGIIGLADGGRPMLSQQFYAQQSFKTWLHGGRDNLINTSGCGTTTPLRLSGNRTGKNTIPLCDIELTTGVPGWATNTGGGIAGTGFLAGASAFQIDNIVAAEMKRVAWSGFDQPFVLGDEVYNLHFEDWSAGQNNVGINWVATGADSGERVFFENGCASNNNYGFKGDYTGPNNSSQGGSVFLKGNSFDYNIVRQIDYLGLPNGNYNAQNGLHIIGNHIETTGACSGTTPRIHSRGSVFLADNEFYENDATRPTGFIESEAFSSVSAVLNRMGADGIPLVITGTSSLYVRVEGYGNVGQNPNQPVILLKATDGTFLQPSMVDGTGLEVGGDPGLFTLPMAKRNLVLEYSGNLTLPSDAQVNHPIGTIAKMSTIGGVINFTKGDGNVVFFHPASGTTGNVNLANNSQIQIRKYAANSWMFEGVGFSPA